MYVQTFCEVNFLREVFYLESDPRPIFICGEEFRPIFASLSSERDNDLSEKTVLSKPFISFDF